MLDKPLIIDQEFKNESQLALAEYDSCTFEHCVFSEQILSQSEF